MLCRNTTLKCYAVCLCGVITGLMLYKIQPFLFLQRCRDIARPADETGLSFLSNTALEDGFYKDLPLPLYKVFNLIHACLRP